jgi:hypothetical protein
MRSDGYTTSRSASFIIFFAKAARIRLLPERARDIKALYPYRSEFI